MQNPDATKGESTAGDTIPGTVRATNTRRAYATDWSLFARWCRGAGLDPLPPRAETVALYLTRLATGSDRAPALSVPSIERRLSGLVWNYAERGMPLDRGDPRIVAAMAGVRRGSSRTPAQKVAVTADDILAKSIEQVKERLN